jgi:hypothetical protein
MPEISDSNVGMARDFTERTGSLHSAEHKMLEFIEVLVLATVAMVTALSGYEADLWTGRQSQLYGEANKLRIQAEGIRAAANQERLYTAVTVVEWLKAKAQGEVRLAEIFERRLLPEFVPAFEAWKKQDPVNNPNAPAGPQLMPEFRNNKTEQQWARLSEQATAVFNQGTDARIVSDDYMRLTVILAAVLLLTAVSQRSKLRVARASLVGVAAVMLLFSIYRLVQLPHLR